MAPRETENNAYAKFWGDKQRHYGMLWYFWSGQLVERARIFTSISVDSSPRSYLVNSGQRNNCSYWIKVWHRTYPICDASFSGSAQHSFAPLQESRRV